MSPRRAVRVCDSLWISSAVRWLRALQLIEGLLLAVEQMLSLVAARLSLVDLVLARVVSILAAIELGLFSRDVHRVDEVRRVRCSAFAVEVGLLSVDRTAVEVDHRLLSVGDALIEIGQRLLLIQRLLSLSALDAVLVVGHGLLSPGGALVAPVSSAVWSRGPGLAMW